MPEQTTRKQITDALRDRPLPGSALAAEFDVTRSQVYDHLEHVAQSLPNDEEFLVAPPECDDCGFSGFDDPVNAPSRCPECKSESIEEPVFVVEAAD